MKYLALMLLVACSSPAPSPTPQAVSAALATGNDCYPNPCERGLRDEGICSCEQIEPACAVVYGEGYESVCPALLTWAAACISGR